MEDELFSCESTRGMESKVRNSTNWWFQLVIEQPKTRDLIGWFFARNWAKMGIWLGFSLHFVTSCYIATKHVPHWVQRFTVKMVNRLQMTISGVVRSSSASDREQLRETRLNQCVPEVDLIGSVDFFLRNLEKEKWFNLPSGNHFACWKISIVKNRTSSIIRCPCSISMMKLPKGASHIQQNAWQIKWIVVSGLYPKISRPNACGIYINQTSHWQNILWDL